jgi:1,4-dihydroxy-2-naphthoyl-CoA synthase
MNRSAAVPTPTDVLSYEVHMTVDHHWKFAEMFAFMLQRTEDALEGPKAFAEKRKPEWKMR